MPSPLTLQDTYLVKTIQKAALSPDGAWVAYIQSEPVRGLDASRYSWV